jgi:hypothetical protein
LGGEFASVPVVVSAPILVSKAVVVPLGSDPAGKVIIHLAVFFGLSPLALIVRFWLKLGGVPFMGQGMYSIPYSNWSLGNPLPFPDGG